MIRFIHTADWHLDRPFSGLAGLPETILERVKESTFSALSRLVERAIAEEIDFMIIAGDVFDASHRSLRAQRRFIQAMRRLREAGIDVFVSFGNHDHLDDPWNRLELPDNVHLFGTQPEMIPFEKHGKPRVNLYGFSYPERYVKTNKLPYYQKKTGADYHIGILHGALKSGGAEDRYAPFTLDGMMQKDFDYWALGHIHKRGPVSADPPIWYPGNIQGLSVKETGEKGASIVELDEHGAQTFFFPTADILWVDKRLKIPEESDIKDALAAVEKAKDELRNDERGVFLRIEAVLSSRLIAGNDPDVFISEWLESARDGEAERSDFVWPLSINLTIEQEWDHERLIQSPHFIGDLMRLLEKDIDMDEILQPLVHHPVGKKFMPSLSESEKEQVIQEAEGLLVSRLLKER